MDSFTRWAGLSIGIWFLLTGGHAILTGEPGITYLGFFSRGDVRAHLWVSWLRVPAGVWVLYWAVRAFLRARENPEPEPTVISDEDAARLKAELDAMYVREHGTLPQPPPLDEEDKKP